MFKGSNSGRFRPSNTGRYTVKPHNPIVQWLFRVVVLAAIGGAVWAGYEYGMIQGGYQRAAAQGEIEDLTEQIGMLNHRINELTVENARLASNSAIDATANEQVSERLRELNEEILELKEELVFYRSLLSPADLEPGLQILGVQLIRNGAERTYDYKIVLTQRRNRNNYAAGHVALVLNGTREGESLRLEAADVLAGADDDALDFRFKNFQSLEGRLSLPEAFDPQEIVVSVVPSNRSLKTVERNYDWNSIVTGG